MNEEKGSNEDSTLFASGQNMDRRQFLQKLSLILGAACATIIGIPVIGSSLSPLLRKKTEVWRSLGKISQFKIGETVNVTFQQASPSPWAGVTAKTAAWLRRESETTFIAFAVNCSHLGCPVRWVAEAELFMCPCHGGVYYKDGRVAAGPPPLPLSRYPVRLRNGEVELQTMPTPITT